jgi:signal peptidase I
VGLPGETLEIRNDQVYINGEPLDEPYAYFEPNEKRSRQAQGLSSASPVSSFGPVSIPEGKIFAMGDNRYNSADSRYWGFVEMNTISGKGQIIYWSHDPGQSLVSGYQLGRVFDLLK